MKILTTFILIFTITFSFAQEKYFVNATNGLSCRIKPDVDAVKIGKLPYGSIVELVTKTSAKLSITDNGKIIEGNWVEIKFTNFPYLVSTKGDIGYEQKAYVFDGYLEPLNKATITIKEITKDEFKQYQISTVENSSDLTKITDFTNIKNKLKDKITWYSVNENEDQFFIDSLVLDNGQILKINKESNDYSVTAYYPEEEILVFEGGHTSDYSISLKTGEMLTTVGNPEYIVTSINNKIRLNGYFPGQECSAYFFQEIKNNKLIYLTDFGWNSVNGENVCNFKTFLWINDTQFIYTYLDYSTNVQGGVLKYKKGTFIKTIFK